MRIAVMSSDKKEVNERFGKANRFLIYEQKNGGLQLVAERVSEPLTVDYFDLEMCDWIADIIKDCQKVYMTRISKQAERAVIRRGITPVVYQGPIDKIIP
ncbi:MAG: hypothetical protein HY789_08805 [Deltaproteobacteria bacterium]|nr:hypothetical protein [Deltaproteobacteria bacterium]